MQDGKEASTEKSEPNIIGIRIERMVNGYIVDVSETTGAVDYGARTSATIVGPRHLVTSREALVDLLSYFAPTTLTKPVSSVLSGLTIEERKW